MSDQQPPEQPRPTGELWQRQAEVVAVDHPERAIDLIVIPYDTEALVGWEGRMVRETIAAGSFTGIERRANRVRVNRDHNLERTVGRASAFHPDRPEGLIARVRIARTPLGDETLELADDGCLDASAGFLPMADGMLWRSRDAYTVTKAWLGHIALTPEPAYENARVLAVRSLPTGAAGAPPSASATPRLDTVIGWLREDRLTRMVGSDATLKQQL